MPRAGLNAKGRSSLTGPASFLYHKKGNDRLRSGTMPHQCRCFATSRQAHHSGYKSGSKTCFPRACILLSKQPSSIRPAAR